MAETIIVKPATTKVAKSSLTWATLPSWNNKSADPNSSVFPDLRKEMHTWLYGNEIEWPRGPWIIHREMLLDQVSPKWDDETKESYKGYRWIYKDHLIRARRPTYPGGVPNEEVDALGIVTVPEDKFFCEWNTNIKKEDYIITLTKFDFLEQPTPNLITIDTEYAIVRVDRVEGDLGRIEYLRLSVKKTNPNPELSILRF